MVIYVKRYEDINMTPKLKILHYDFNDPNGVEVDASNNVTRVLDLSNTRDHASAVNVKFEQALKNGKYVYVGRFNKSNIFSEKSQQILPKRYYIKMVLQIHNKYDSYFLDTTGRKSDGMSMWFNSYYGPQLGVRSRTSTNSFNNEIKVNTNFNYNDFITVEYINNNTIGEKSFLAINDIKVGEVTNTDDSINHTTILSIGATLDRGLYLDGRIQSIEIYDLDKISISLIKTKDNKHFTFIGDQLTIVPESETSEDKLFETIKTKGFSGSTPERMQAIQKDLPYSEFSLVTLEL